MNHMLQDKSAFTRICLADAVFSSGSVLLMTVLSRPVADLFGPAIPQWLIFAVGLGLVPWALFHFHLARRSVFSPELARISIGGDAIWVAASAGLLIFDAHLFSAPGVSTIAGVALVVAGMGIAKSFTSRVHDGPMAVTGSH